MVLDIFLFIVVVILLYIIIENMMNSYLELIPSNITNHSKNATNVALESFIR